MTVMAESVEEDDDGAGCTLRTALGGTCYCTRRPGCVSGDDDLDDDCLYCGRADCRGDCDDGEDEPGETEP